MNLELHDGYWWVRGVPDVHAVKTHFEVNGQVYGPAGGYVKEYGANWLCIDEDNAFGPMPHIIRLRVINGVIMLDNGYSFTQPLAECTWAARSRYLPLTREGIPLASYRDIDK